MAASGEINVAALAEAVKAGDQRQVRVLLNARPELIHTDMSADDEHRALHFAVLGRDSGMVKLLMEAGADARKGIWPHRDATSALAIARDREYREIVAVIEEEERLRREDLSCPNATVSPVQEQVNAAIGEGDRATAMRLLDSDRTLIQACDRNGRTPLHAAAGAADEELVRWLLERRARVDQPDIRGWTPIDVAALTANANNGHAERFPAIAKLLLDHGAELTIRAAVALGRTDRATEMIEGNRELLGQIDSNGGLLTLAVKHGQLEVARRLLELGADVDERVHLPELEEPTLSWGMPLWHAALGNHYALAELLLGGGADPNANVYASGWPIRNAWNHPDGAVKRLLLARGAKPHPYMVAENRDLVGAEHLLASDSSEEVASELAWSGADHGCPDILRVALPRLNWPRDDPRWHWTLIQPMRGVDPDVADSEAWFESLEVILEHGIDPNISRKGETSLHFTAARPGGESSARFASILIKHGARLDMRDDLLKSTALGWACRWGRTEMVQVLLERGAPVDEPDAEAWATPMAWARKMKRPEIVALLRGASPQEPIM